MSGSRKVWPEILEIPHSEKLNDEKRYGDFPEFFAESEATDGVENGKEAGEKNADGKTDKRLAAHCGDVTGETKCGEEKEDAEKKTGDGFMGNVAPVVLRCAHGIEWVGNRSMRRVRIAWEVEERQRLKAKTKALLGVEHEQDAEGNHEERPEDAENGTGFGGRVG